MTLPTHQRLALSAAEQTGALVGQTALVTGGSSGIGQAVAASIGRAGADVLIGYHSDEDGASETARLVRDAGLDHAGRTERRKVNVGDPDSVAAFFAAADDTFGAVDILVSNAGIQKDAAFLEMSFDDWSDVLSVNLHGQFLCAKAAAERFVKQGVREGVSRAAGKIVCMSSVHDVVPWAGRANYAASKGGLDMFMRTIAQELAPKRVRVNAVCPGAVRTPINEDAWKDEDAYRRLMTKIPYGRIGETEDVANLCTWLCTDEADYVTGASLYIDGGMTLFPSFTQGG